METTFWTSKRVCPKKRTSRQPKDPFWAQFLANGPVFLFLSICVSQSAFARNGLTIDHLETQDLGSTLYFKTPEFKLETPYTDLEYLGNLSLPSGANTFFVIGKPCLKCSDERAILWLDPQGKKLAHFTVPGKIIDPKKREVLLDSRAFFGQCLKGVPAGYFVFQREKLDRKPKLQSSVFQALPALGRDQTLSLVEKLQEKRPPSITHTLKAVKDRDCTEISTKNRMMSNRALDLKVRQDLDSPDAEEAERDEQRTDPALETDPPPATSN